MARMTASVIKAQNDSGPIPRFIVTVLMSIEIDDRRYHSFVWRRLQIEVIRQPLYSGESGLSRSMFCFGALNFHNERCTLVLMQEKHYFCDGQDDTAHALL